MAALYSYILRNKSAETVKRVLIFLANSGTFSELSEFLAMFQHDLNLYDRKLVLDAFGLMSEEETEKYYKWLETFCKKGYLMQD